MDERQALAQLRDVLANLYSDVATIRRIVHDAGLNEERIDFSQRAQDSWHAVLREAQKHERVEALLEIATKEYANNSGLQAAQESYQAAKSKNLTATAPKNQVANKPGRYLVTPGLAIFLMATGLILFVIIFQASITKMLMSVKQPATPTEAKVIIAKVAEVTATTAISATLETPTFTPIPTVTSTAIAAPTTVPTPTPGYPCEATVIDPDGGQKVGLLYEFKEGGNKRKVPALSVGAKINIVEINPSKLPDGTRYHIKTGSTDWGWIPSQYLEVSSSCPKISS